MIPISDHFNAPKHEILGNSNSKLHRTLLKYFDTFPLFKKLPYYRNVPIYNVHLSDIGQHFKAYYNNTNWHDL